MLGSRRLILRLAALAGLGVLTPAAKAGDSKPDASWPETLVKFEDLRPLTAFELVVPGVVATGRVTGPAVLKVHLSAEGGVVRIALLESCGNPDLDEAAIHAMRVMRFKPYTFGGTATAVTLLVPVHVPVRLGRAPR